MTRPTHTRKDSNHAAVRDELRADGYIVIDVADLPGDPQHNPLDLLVMRRVAQPPVIVALSAAGVRQWFAQHPAANVVQVEVKPGWNAPLTEDEAAYFESLGIPPERWA